MSIGRKPKNLKQGNSRTLIELMRKSDMLSVTDVSEKIKLSKTTVKKIFDSLLLDGLIFAAGKGDSTDEGGKKPELYCLNKDFGYTICIHVTPDEILVATTDFKAEITHLEKVEIKAERELAGLIERFAVSIEAQCRLKQTSGQQLLGVSLILTSLVDAENGISIHSFFYPGWGENAPIVALLQHRLGPDFKVPIYADNTNRYQALAESSKELAAGYRNFIIVDALPEGLGSGIVLNGVILRGLQSISGEIGHMTLESRGGFPCVCGNRGCFEAMVSERRLLSLARKLAPNYLASSLFAEKKIDAISLEDICHGVTEKDPMCICLIDDVVRWFVVGLGNIIMISDPELIVIQGIYTKAGPYFLEQIKKGIKHIGLPRVEKKVSIVYSSLGEERGVIGGAVYAITKYLSAHVY